MPVAVRMRGLTKRFRPGRDTLLDAILGLAGRRAAPPPVTALEDLDLDVERGETLGIVGVNGAGKTTLLKIVAGITRADEGTVAAQGRVAPLLEVGAGFHPLLTGRENVFVNGMLLGATRAEIDARFDAIVDFAGIGAALDHPVATYSSGMYLRLGFAVAAHADPAILVIDETLAVGDLTFQAQCLKRMAELRDAGTTILFVSHDLSLVGASCDRVCLIDGGRLRGLGRPDDIVADYRVLVSPDAKVAARGKYGVRFAGGHMALSHDARVVTRAYGLYTSLKYLGAWHDSSQATWDVEQVDASTFVARGRMARLPVTQEWRVETSEDGVRVAIHLDLARPLPLHDMQASVLCPDAYTQWRIGQRSGEFPPFDLTSEWRHVDDGADDADDVALAAPESSTLPSLVVTREGGEARLTTVLNASPSIRARVVQFLALSKSPDGNVAAGRHLLFAGKFQAR